MCHGRNTPKLTRLDDTGRRPTKAAVTPGLAKDCTSSKRSTRYGLCRYPATSRPVLPNIREFTATLLDFASAIVATKTSLQITIPRLTSVDRIFVKLTPSVRIGFWPNPAP